MFNLPRLFLGSKFLLGLGRAPVRSLTKQPLNYRYSNGNNQIEYIKSVLQNSEPDWENLKSNVLNIRGVINKENFEGVLLRTMISEKKFDTALLFSDHLIKCDKLTLGAINGILELYYEIGKQQQLTNEMRQFILDQYKSLYAKYKILDQMTSQRLLHALCVIDEWKLAIKILDDVYFSGTPSHSSYSTIIATLFRNNKKTEAMDLISKSLENLRPLTDIAYEAWIEYVIRKYKTNKSKVKYLDEICMHIANNFVTLSEKSANLIINVYTSVGWNVLHSKILKQNGQCVCCKKSLDCQSLTEDEFQLLQQNVKQKLIIGKNLFLKTSPAELNKFLDFVKRTAPYDIVLDALNIAFTASAMHNVNRVNTLSVVVHHFVEQKKKIMLLGRKHMLHWPKRPMEYIMSNTSCFFTEDASQDDPFFITAAILSGSHTDIVTRDLLRNHQFLMKDEQLRIIFKKWQWQHQWRVTGSKHGRSGLLPPLSFTPCAQKNDAGWHIPFQRDDLDTHGEVRDGLPDWSSWLCLQPPSAPAQPIQAS